MPVIEFLAHHDLIWQSAKPNAIERIEPWAKTAKAQRTLGYLKDIVDKRANTESKK